MQTAIGFGGGFIFGNWVRSCSEGLQKSGPAAWKPWHSHGDHSLALAVQASGGRAGPGQADPSPPRGWAEGARTAPPPPRRAPAAALTQS